MEGQLMACKPSPLQFIELSTQLDAPSLNRSRSSKKQSSVKTSHNLLSADPVDSHPSSLGSDVDGIDAILNILTALDKRNVAAFRSSDSTTSSATSLSTSKMSARLTRAQVIFLLNKASEILLKDETLVEVSGPVVICGDLHGQFSDILTIMKQKGYPPKTRYLFMGDYVDRGDQSIELTCFLLAMKIKYPSDVYLLRGNHESCEVNAQDGFKDDCMTYFDVSLWEAFQDCFRCLPLAGLVGQKILCMHGGISSAFQKLDDLRKIPRPVEVPDNGLVCDILWSDPLPDTSQCLQQCGFKFNDGRNTSVYFCTHVVEDFLSRNHLDLIVRGHELPEAGYSFSLHNKVLTLFTAPRYCGGNNDAAILCVSSDNKHDIQTFQFGSLEQKADQSSFVDEKTRRESPKSKV